jgi:hypothetical protein
MAAGQPKARPRTSATIRTSQLGRAAVIAEGLRESGYPECTADVVTAELARPQGERGVIGRFAADQLERAGWRP